MNRPFKDLKPFPGTASANERIQPGANKPPLDEQLVADLDEALTVEGITRRVAELVAAGDRVTEVTSAEQGGRYADFVRMCGEAAKGIEAEREKLNRPLLNGQRALKARADALIAQLTVVSSKARKMVEAFHAEQRRLENERRIAAEAAARHAQEEADRIAEQARASGQAEEVAPTITVAPAAVEAAPAIQGDYGAKVGTSTVWKHEIESVRKLPDSILKHQKVIDALNQVIGQQVRSGTREIKGVRIWSEQATVIR